MKIKVIAFLLILAVCPFLKHTEITGKIIVQAMAVDYDAEKGMYTFTIMYPKGEDAFGDICASGESLYQCINDVSDNTGKLLIMSECQVIAFGNLGKNMDIQKVTESLTSVYEMYPKVYFCAIDGDAGEFITHTQGTGENKNIIWQLQETLQIRGSTRTVSSRALFTRFSDESQELYLPVFQTYTDGKEKQVRFCGGAVYKDEDYKVSVSKEIAAATAMFSKDTDTIWIITEEEEGKAEQVQEILKIDYDLCVKETEDGRMKLSFKFDIKARFTDTVKANKQTFEESGGEEERLSRKVKEMLLSAVECAKETESDYLTLSPRVKNKNPKLFDKYSEDWGKSLSKAEFDIAVNTKFIAFGTRW